MAFDFDHIPAIFNAKKHVLSPDSHPRTRLRNRLAEADKSRLSHFRSGYRQQVCQTSRPSLQEAEGRQAEQYQPENRAEVAVVDIVVDPGFERAEVAAEQAEAADDEHKQQGDQLYAAQEEDGGRWCSGGGRRVGGRRGLAEDDLDGRQVRAFKFLGCNLLR